MNYKTELSTKFNLRTMYDLLYFVGRELSGRRDLVLRWEPPAHKNVDATAQIGLDGRPVIRFDPAITQGGKDWIRLYLHEVAHVRIHGPYLRRADTELPPRSEEYKVFPATRALVQREEDQADTLAEQWLSWAKNRLRGEGGDPSDPEAILWELTKYR